MKLCGGRWYQSVTAAAPAGASGNKGLRRRFMKPFADRHGNFCNEIGQIQTHAAQKIPLYSISVGELRWLHGQAEDLVCPAHLPLNPEALPCGLQVS